MQKLYIRFIRRQRLTAFPCNGGQPYHPTQKFGDPLKGDFLPFNALPCTKRQFSEAFRTAMFPIIAFNIIISLV